MSDPVISRLPSNLEVEQALLGILLYDNDAIHRFSGLTEDHFFEPLHAELFALIVEKTSAGKLADPMIVNEAMGHSKAYAELGGVRYLADLIDHAGPSAGAKDYAEEIVDCARRRALIRACGDAAQASDEDRTRTGAQHIEDLEQELFSLAETSETKGFRPFKTFAESAVESAAAAYQRNGGLAGISTGLIDLDQKLGGLVNSDLIIVAGRPSMGKTALATNIAFNIARTYEFEVQPDGKRKTTAGGIVGFFSLEMSGDQLAARILAEASGVSSDRMRRGAIEAYEFAKIRDAKDLLASIPLHVDDSGAVTIAQVASRARRMKRTSGLDLVIVDYLQLLSGSKRYDGGQRTQEVSEITVGLKAMAKDLNVPVVALSQLSRNVESREDKRPQLSDLRESGSIEQDADVVMFCYREEYYVSRTEPDPITKKDLHNAWMDQMDEVRGKADVIVGKQRHGPIGTVKLAFNSDLTLFSDLPRTHPQHAPRTAYGDDQ
ncbi:MAG: replicative DNA helicase [Brevundimonas sp.]